MFITPKRLFKTSEKPCHDSELAQQEHRRETESKVVSERSHGSQFSYTRFAPYPFIGVKTFVLTSVLSFLIGLLGGVILTRFLPSFARLPSHFGSHPPKHT